MKKLILFFTLAFYCLNANLLFSQTCNGTETNPGCTIEGACNYDPASDCNDGSCVFPSPVVGWQNTIGGSGEDHLQSVNLTSDGGFILGGHSTSSPSGDKVESNIGGWDYWIVKIDNIGNVIWQNTIGGSSNDIVLQASETSDGGYIVAGYSQSGANGDKTEGNIGGYDNWLVKLDSSGNIEWQNSIGGSAWEYLFSVEETSDGGYILGSASASGISGDKTENAMSWDYWVIKVSVLGVIEWQNTISGSGDDRLISIQEYSGNYLIAGHSSSGVSGDKTSASFGSFDIWVLGLDGTGSIIWQNSYGGSANDYFASMIKTTDGDFVITSSSSSGISGNKTENSIGNQDYWVLKIDDLGNIIWQNTIGGSGDETSTDLVQTSDGGFLLGGYSSSNISGDKSQNSLGGNDYWPVKIDAAGDVVWDKTVGGSSEDVMNSICVSSTGDIIMGGRSNSAISGDKTENTMGAYDYWVVELTYSAMQGCTDDTACNYDSNANCDDGSCAFTSDCLGVCGGTATEGCIDNSACNYDSNADCDDGSCIYTTDCLGVCGGTSTEGCTDIAAINYDSSAACDDGTCNYCLGSVTYDTTLPEPILVGSGLSSDHMAVSSDCAITAGIKAHLRFNGDIIPTGDTYRVQAGESPVSGSDPTPDPGTAAWNYLLSVNLGTLTFEDVNVFLDIDFDPSDGGGQVGPYVGDLSQFMIGEGLGGTSLIQDSQNLGFGFWQAIGSGDILPFDPFANGVYDLAVRVESLSGTEIINVPIRVEVFTEGCTDVAATNYNASATDDDGSCAYCSGTVTYDTTLPDPIIIGSGLTGDHMAVSDDCAITAGIKAFERFTGDIIPTGDTYSVEAGESPVSGSDPTPDPGTAAWNYLLSVNLGTLTFEDVNVFLDIDFDPSDGGGQVGPYVADLSQFMIGEGLGGTSLIQDSQNLGFGFWQAIGSSDILPFDPFANGVYDLAVRVESLSGTEIINVPIRVEVFTEGCTDVAATNYDAAANEDDGSCTYCSGTVAYDTTLPDPILIGSGLNGDNMAVSDDCAITAGIKAHLRFNGNIVPTGDTYRVEAGESPVSGSDPTPDPGTAAWNYLLSVNLGTLTFEDVNVFVDIDFDPSDGGGQTGPYVGDLSQFMIGEGLGGTSLIQDSQNLGFGFWQAIGSGDILPFDPFATGVYDLAVRVESLSGTEIINVPIRVEVFAEGCTDVAATNYDAGASEDDGSCTYCSGTVTYDTTLPDPILIGTGLNGDNMAVSDDCAITAGIKAHLRFNGNIVPTGDTYRVEAGESPVSGSDPTPDPGTAAWNYLLSVNLGTLTFEDVNVFLDIDFDPSDGGGQVGPYVGDLSQFMIGEGLGGTSLIQDSQNLGFGFWQAIGSGDILPFDPFANGVYDLAVRVESLSGTEIINVPIRVEVFTEGCTDVAATNYNAAATDDDGSCTYCSGTVTYDTTLPDPIIIGSGLTGDHMAVSDDCAITAGIKAHLRFTGDIIPTGDTYSVEAGESPVSGSDPTPDPGTAAWNYLLSVNLGTLTFEDVNVFLDIDFDPSDGGGQTGPYVADLSQFMIGEGLGGSSLIQDSQNLGFGFWQLIGSPDILPFDPFANGVYDLAIRVESLSGEEIINVPIRVEVFSPGCTDPAAENFDSNASQDDGSCTFCQGTVDYNTTLPDPIVIGSGLSGDHMAVSSDCDITAGIKAHLRFTGDIIPMGDTYVVESGESPVSGSDPTPDPGTARWNYLISVNLGTLTFEDVNVFLDIDFDPSDGVGQVGPYVADLSQFMIGEGLGGSSLLQDSQNLGFGFWQAIGSGDILPFDPFANGVYDLAIRIESISGTELVIIPIRVEVFTPGCTVPLACNYDSNANEEDGSCEYTSCAGCMSVVACNYDPAATIEDGSCEYTSCAGCTYPGSPEYDATATIDDGSCTCEVATTCSGDANFDGEVDILDLVAVSSNFGSICP